MEKVYFLNSRIDSYLRIYSKNSILGGISYYAERHCDGKLCRKYQIEEKAITPFITFYDNIFRIANRRKWRFNNNMENTTRLKSFIESQLYRKMWDYFLGGLHILFSEDMFGFSLTANHNQFNLTANKEKCQFRIIGNPKFKSIDPDFWNYNDCNTMITREEGELFLSALAYKLWLELTTTPMVEIKSISNISSDNYYLMGLTVNIHDWYKSVAYHVLT